MAWLKLSATEYGVVTSLLPPWLDDETRLSLGGVAEGSDEHHALKERLEAEVREKFGKPKKLERFRTKCR